MKPQALSGSRCICRNKPATCIETFRQIAGKNLPLRRRYFQLAGVLSKKRRIRGLDCLAAQYYLQQRCASLRTAPNETLVAHSRKVADFLRTRGKPGPVYAAILGTQLHALGHRQAQLRSDFRGSLHPSNSAVIRHAQHRQATVLQPYYSIRVYCPSETVVWVWRSYKKVPSTPIVTAQSSPP